MKQFAYAAVAGMTLAGCSAAGPTEPTEDPGLPVGALLDSVAFVQAIRTLAQSPSVPRAAGPVSVAYAMYDDSVSWIQPLWDQPVELADSLTAIIRRVAKPSLVPEAQSGITLRIAIDETAEVSARASVRELPVFLNREEITTAIQALANDHGIAGSWTFFMRVDQQGDIVEIQAQESTSDPEFGQLLADLLTGCRFEPATIDGFPVPVWVSLPVNVHVDAVSTAPYNAVGASARYARSGVHGAYDALEVSSSWKESGGA